MRIHFISFGDISSSPENSGLKWRSYEIAKAFHRIGYLASISCFTLEGGEGLQSVPTHTYSGSWLSKMATLIKKTYGNVIGDARYKTFIERHIDELFFDMYLAHVLKGHLREGDVILDSKSISTRLQAISHSKKVKYVSLVPVCNPLTIKEKLEAYCEYYQCTELTPYMNDHRTSRYIKFLRASDGLFSLLPSKVAEGSYEGLGDKNKLVCPSFITRPHDTFYSGQLKCPHGEVRFLADAGGTHKKGLLLLLDAWQRMDNQNARLSIIGTPIIDSEFSSQHIDWLPRTSRLSDYFANHDVFICPSVIDLGPRIAFEALASATPIITSSTTGVASVLPSDAGLIFQAGDARSLFNCVEELTMNPNSIRMMSSAARQYANTFSTSAFVTELTEFLEVVNKNGEAR